MSTTTTQLAIPSVAINSVTMLTHAGLSTARWAVASAVCGLHNMAVRGLFTAAPVGIGGRADPTDLWRETNPMLHQAQASTHGGEGELALGTRVAGVVAYMEPGVPRPGTVQPPEPSAALKAKVPIMKVTTDKDVLEPPEDGGSSPNVPLGRTARN